MDHRLLRHDRTRLAVGGVAVLALVVGAAGVAGVLRGAGTAPIPRFVDATAASGLDFSWDGDLQFAVGGGVAVFDCDGDGRSDLYFAGGAGKAALFLNQSRPGNLRFTQLRSEATDLTAVNGAYPIDIDGDGVTDLVTLRHGENMVLRGLGSCRFERANEAWGIDGGNEPTEAFSATWERGAAFPTLAFGNYVDLQDFDLDHRCRPNVLLRPVAGGAAASPTPSYGPPIPLEPSYCALSMLFSDWSGAGAADLRVSNDRAYYRPDAGSEQLWRISPGAAPALYGQADGWSRVQVEGMGIGSQDLDGDGKPEIYLTSQGASKLQTLATGATGPTYADIGLDRGVNVTRPFTGPDTNLPSTAWHPEFADVNDDGLLDLFVSKGNVRDQPDFAIEDPSNLLLGEADGSFVEAADKAGVLAFDRGRGAALVDLDLDGRLDLVESFYGAAARVWRNEGGGGAAHWLAVRLHEPGPNGDAIGAVVEVRAGDWSQRREIVVGGGHGGGQLGWLHVGLGNVTGGAPELRVRWPDGEVGPWQAIELDAFSTVDREHGVAVWTPPS